MNPPPTPTSDVTRRKMQANRRRDTEPERLLRSELHRRGRRYRTDLRFQAQDRYVRPDIVFTRSRVAVFVDGCFWHRCPKHASDPRSNIEFWQSKFDANLRRDRADDAALQRAGWTVVRVWAHEEAGDAADRVEAELTAVSATTEDRRK
jgi:DNA mismatch endonuclease, patch repair protein